MKLSVIFGTRPEIIKLAPLALHARKCGHEVNLVFTGQHRDMVMPLMRFFGLTPDLDLQAMKENQKLTDLSTRILTALSANREKINADYLLVQGDTTSAFVAAYWGFLNQIPIAHVEAGLRTYDLTAPYPEEANRQLIGRVATLHFAPTTQSALSLKNERVQGTIHIVGNTSIDALLYSLGRIRLGDTLSSESLPSGIREFSEGYRTILVTAHRRENHGDGLQKICDALQKIVESERDVRVIYPIHPNPNVRGPVMERLAQHKRILLCDPLPYLGFIEMMDRASVLVTDSGGVQEEGPTLRKPIVVMRETTERPEGVEAGFAKLVGTNTDLIVTATLDALANGCTTDAINPYGDGFTSERITKIIEDTYDLKNDRRFVDNFKKTA